MDAPSTPRPFRAADWVAGLSIAGLLLPEAVAYSGIAGLPPQAGVVALLVGLFVYGLLGTSRFAIVSATSSSAAVLLAATNSAVPGELAMRVAFGAGIVVLTGVFFLIAAAARLGAVSNLIAKPVLRGFALGLALTIVVKQIPKVVDVHTAHSDFLRLSWELVASVGHWNLAGLAMAAIGVALLQGLGHWRATRAVPAALLVIAAGIALDLAGVCRQWGIDAVGPIDFKLMAPSLPELSRELWLRMGELAFAMALILYAESYGSIRTFALRHGDLISANRDLMALGAANLASGLFQGMPVGAGFSATSANEAAGAQSRAAGLIAGGVVLLAAIALLPWIAHTPEPLLAAIVIHAVGHTLNPGSLRPYFSWRRDRLVALVAFVAVLLLGVLDGLLAAIGVSLLLLLRGMSTAHVSWLGRLGEGHDFVDIARHPEARVPTGMLIARPDTPLFFGNVEAVFSAIQAKLEQVRGLDHVVLVLEESADLDGTSIEALCDFAAHVHQRGAQLTLARVKDRLRDLLDQVRSGDLPPSAYAAWSVDDAVQQAQRAGAAKVDSVTPVLL
ncbi:SulP family inorganic anion transporter [Variovorax sp. Sphag1AA]|uniref:SulP family inorganic anion transporter n=1 Tax=Variovorax sp. Sphag1AA TaxID=2587027 RepID=UPI00161322A2|nr:SulP family inorganic anion transporter [Variovorax sp. Sphag1AA]MBB3180144.1 MFS superfamily sulfate permease-like transporter [Variovorax sp. Sphag1AA]